MLNIKQTFAPSASAAPGRSSVSVSGVGPSATITVTPRQTQTPLPPKRKSGLNLLLGITLLVLAAVGGSVATYLTGVRQDLRQQAYGTPNYTCHTIADCPPGNVSCTNGYCVHSNDHCDTYADCPPGYDYCNLDSHTCAHAPTPIPDSPTPSSGAGGTCGPDFHPGPTNCTAINANNCSGYRTCHGGAGYDACYPNPGTNTCTYNIGGTTCTAQCPDTMPDGLSRCQCNNGVWTIGVVPAGGSCDQLCACTGNTCTTCGGSPTPGPSGHPTNPPNPTNTPPAGPQCTNIQMLNLAGNPITGNGDQNLQPGDPVKFRCSATGTVQHYEFRVILPDGTIKNKNNTPALVAVGNITGEFAIPMIGNFTAQCRICTSATTCQAYENPAGTAGQHCGGNVANPQGCPGGYTCQLDPNLPDGGGTCELINNTHPTPIPTVNATGQACGGTIHGNVECPAGYTCHVTNPRLPDAGGTCQPN